MVQKVLVATDQSESAGHAVRWAADMAARFSAELILLQVVPPSTDGPADHEHTVDSLRAMADELAGPRGRARVVVDADPARGIVQACDDLAVDVCVVGNLGMSGRTTFLLGNVPNRVS
ncbi:MAG: universal stress protein, partial [Actinomycetota bacterium]